MASVEITQYTVYPTGFAEAQRPTDKHVFAITVTDRGKGWSVEHMGFCLSRSGEWEWQPIPSERDDAFFERCRFTEDEGRRRALEVIDQVVVNGVTFAQVSR